MIPRVLRAETVTDRRVTLYLEDVVPVLAAPGPPQTWIRPTMLVIRWIDGNVVKAVLEGPRINPNGTDWVRGDGRADEIGRCDVLRTPLNWTRELIEEYAE